MRQRWHDIAQIAGVIWLVIIIVVLGLFPALGVRLFASPGEALAFAGGLAALLALIAFAIGRTLGDDEW